MQQQQFYLWVKWEPFCYLWTNQRHFHGLASTKESCYIAVPVANMVAGVLTRKQHTATRRKEERFGWLVVCCGVVGWGTQTGVEWRGRRSIAELPDESLFIMLLNLFFSINKCLLPFRLGLFFLGQDKMDSNSIVVKDLRLSSWCQRNPYPGLLST